MMILVTGGTGFIGQEVVRELIALGYRVRLLVRDPRRAAHLACHPQVEIVHGDALRPETLPAAMTGVQAVVHLIGIIAETSRITFEQAHIDATQNVLRAAQSAGVTRWIQMSAIGTRPHAASRYHLTKWQAEELVRQSGLDWTLFRPSLVYGYDARDRLLNLLRKVLSWPVNVATCYSFPLLDGGRPLVQPVSVRDVARCFAHAVAKPEAIGKTYDLVGPEPMAWRDMVAKVAATLGKSTVYEEIPLLVILRTLLWLAVALIPILVLIGLVLGHLHILLFAGAALLWTLAVITARRWRQVVIFNIPGDPLLMIGELVSAVAPRSLQFREQLKMAREDNVGDPLPAMQTFDYVPETFDEGVARVVASGS